MPRRRSIHYVEWQLTPHDGKSHGSDARRNNDMFKTIEPKEITRNPFTLIGDDWMLVTAEKDGKANTMTASWGGVGILWGKTVATIYIRPQRYTKEFLEASDHFTLSVLGAEHKKTLGYLGSVSGRDEDKIAKSGLTLAHEDGSPYFEEAELVLVCRKLYKQDQTPESFLDKECLEKWYAAKDYHTMYIAEIEKVLKKA
jgi:flavin reductase (DIM6/NTAB) family NADH-FMN oxidoreductase RutF